MLPTGRPTAGRSRPPSAAIALSDEFPTQAGAYEFVGGFPDALGFQPGELPRAGDGVGGLQNFG